jgi:uncharacterized membrane protein HdeD (DUF308 family)
MAEIVIVDIDSLSRNWWLVVLRGVGGVLFGVLTFMAPGISLAALVLLFGAYAFADGVLAIVTAIRRRASVDRWWVFLIEGLVGIAAGVFTVLWPGITALALVYLISGWAVVTGVLEILAAIRLRKVIAGEWLLALSGILSIVFGAVIALFPGAGALTLVAWIGAYAIVFGALLIALGIRLRTRRRHPVSQAAHGLA